MKFMTYQPGAARRETAGRATALLLTTLALAGIAACATPASNAPASSGAAAGATSAGADARLQTCAQPVGSVRLQDGNAPVPAAQGQAAPSNEHIANVLAVLSAVGNITGGSQQAQQQSNGGAALEALRLLIAQSNCFVIVERGAAAEFAADDEKRRARTGDEVRDNAKLGPGQEAAADYVLRSNVLSLDTTSSRGLNLGILSRFAGGASVGQSVTEAKVQLVLSDVRSKVQIGVAQGEGAGSNTGLATNVLGRTGAALGGVGFKSESKTSGSTILLQAFADAYNKMIPVVQNYKEQQVRGGIGTGGTLSVQGNR